MISRFGWFLFALILFFGHSQDGIAQKEKRFYGGLKLGMNLSQIDGDSVLGFDKLAYNGGFFTGFHLGKTSEIQLEFLYSLRGSKYTKRDLRPIKYNLEYIEVPLIFGFKDWLIEDDQHRYYRIHFQGGLSFGRLFRSSSYNKWDEQFEKNDLSWLLGFNYYFNYNLALNCRYTSSFTPLYRYTINDQEIKMISYFISLGLNYRFN